MLCKSQNFSFRCSIYLVKGSGEEKLLEAKMLNVAKNTGMNMLKEITVMVITFYTAICKRREYALKRTVLILHIFLSKGPFDNNSIHHISD